MASFIKLSTMVINSAKISIIEILENKYCNNIHDECELLVNKELNTAVDIAGNMLLKNLNIHM